VRIVKKPVPATFVDQTDEDPARPRAKRPGIRASRWPLWASGPRPPACC